jgi:hypothetical protein
MAVTAAKASIRVSPIYDRDVCRVAEFLHANLSTRTSADDWAASVAMPWAVDKPNAGFMLLDDEDVVVGAYLAIYSERLVDGRLEKFCNLGAWCVLPVEDDDVTSEVFETLGSLTAFVAGKLR